MRLSRLYSNQPEIFSPVTFNPGLSAVIAEIRLPANKDLDTHNLGKTKVGELLDFCLLKGKGKGQFLFEHAEFDSFVFFLELELLDGTYVTICRPVNPGSRISILRSRTSVSDAREVPLETWNHANLAFERARTLLDGILNLQALAPWTYRKLVGYLIRTQQDYQDVFQLGKFSGKHQDWKPFVAHLLGLPARDVIELYAQRETVEGLKSKLSTLVAEWGSHDDSASLDGLVALKRQAVEAKTQSLDSFDFSLEDQRVTEALVDGVEVELAELNEERYALQQLLSRIGESLAERSLSFRPKDARQLFLEAGVELGDQVVRTFDELVAFNRAISSERRAALSDQANRARHRIEEIDTALLELNAQRARALAFLRDSEALGKYKELGAELSRLAAELAVLEARRESATRLIELRREHREAAENFGRIQTRVESEIVVTSRDETSRFAKLRAYFNEIISHVTGQNALISVRMNDSGGLDFSAEFVGEFGIATSGDKGTTYKKLLCIAFDLALLRSFLDQPFARFVYHDGAFEQLEGRKQERLLEVFREYSGYGLQPVFSALDSDVGSPTGGMLEQAEIVVTLHDESDSGRLFKMPPW